LNAGFYTTLWSPSLDYRRGVDQAIRRVFDRRVPTLLGPSRMFLSQFAVKPAGEASSECPLHQDWSFTDDTKYRVVSIWCPLVDVDSANGCLAVVPGSQWAHPRIRPNGPKEGFYWPFYDVEPILRARYLKEIPMKAGNCVIYDGRIIHGSRTNSTSQDRPAVVATFAPAHAPLYHYWQNTPETVEVFDVDEEFYLSDVEYGHRPAERPLVGILPCAPLAEPITEASFLSAWKNRGAQAAAR
jgi:ectoine hydroxylase-related dioxygenase (phytanoyl-CoA dioxygenase family)